MKKIIFIVLLSSMYSVFAMKKSGKELYKSGQKFYHDSCQWKEDGNDKHALFLLKQSLKRFEQASQAKYRLAYEKVTEINLILSQNAKDFKKKRQYLENAYTVALRAPNNKLLIRLVQHEKKLIEIQQCIENSDLDKAYTKLNNFLCNELQVDLNHKMRAVDMLKQLADDYSYLQAIFHLLRHEQTDPKQFENRMKQFATVCTVLEGADLKKRYPVVGPKIESYLFLQNLIK